MFHFLKKQSPLLRSAKVFQSVARKRVKISGNAFPGFDASKV